MRIVLYDLHLAIHIIQGSARWTLLTTLAACLLQLTQRLLAPTGLFAGVWSSSALLTASVSWGDRQAAEAPANFHQFAPVEGPAAWRAADYRDSQDWIYHFSTEDIRELEAAVAAAQRSGKRTQVETACLLIESVSWLQAFAAGLQEQNASRLQHTSE